MFCLSVCGCPVLLVYLHHVRRLHGAVPEHDGVGSCSHGEREGVGTDNTCTYMIKQRCKKYLLFAHRGPQRKKRGRSPVHTLWRNGRFYLHRRKQHKSCQKLGWCLHKLETVIGRWEYVRNNSCSLLHLRLANHRFGCHGNNILIWSLTDNTAIYINIIHNVQRHDISDRLLSGPWSKIPAGRVR